MASSEVRSNALGTVGTWTPTLKAKNTTTTLVISAGSVLAQNWYRAGRRVNFELKTGIFQTSTVTDQIQLPLPPEFAVSSAFTIRGIGRAVIGTTYEPISFVIYKTGDGTAGFVEITRIFPQDGSGFITAHAYGGWDFPTATDIDIRGECCMVLPDYN